MGLSYRIGGEDQAFFSVDESGSLKFLDNPDFDDESKEFLVKYLSTRTVISLFE